MAAFRAAAKNRDKIKPSFTKGLWHKIFQRFCLIRPKGKKTIPGKSADVDPSPA